MLHLNIYQDKQYIIITSYFLYCDKMVCRKIM